MPDEQREDHTIATELPDGAVRRERELPATPDEAWSLLQDADGLASWLADDVDLVVEPGERGTLRDADGDVREVEVEAVEPGRRLSLRWWTTEGEEALVDLTLTETQRGTRLVVTELPVRAVAVPLAVPSDWTIASGGPSAGPQLLALACH